MFIYPKNNYILDIRRSYLHQFGFGFNVNVNMVNGDIDAGVKQWVSCREI